MEAARRALEAHRLGPELEQDLSRLMELIAVLEKAQKTPMPESQKFGILAIMAHDERPHVRVVYGMASYNKESFNTAIKRGVGYYLFRGSNGGKHRTTVLRSNLLQVPNWRM